LISFHQFVIYSVKQQDSNLRKKMLSSQEVSSFLGMGIGGRSFYVTQADLEFLSSSDRLASASHVPGIACVGHCAKLKKILSVSLESKINELYRCRMGTRQEI
jgi:hypothetical protein